MLTSSKTPSRLKRKERFVDEQSFTAFPAAAAELPVVACMHLVVSIVLARLVICSLLPIEFCVLVWGLLTGHLFFVVLKFSLRDVRCKTFLIKHVSDLRHY